MGFLISKDLMIISQNQHWITGKPERVLVHKWRASEQAILVGAGTIRADDPKLNVREWKGPDPLKLILSSSGQSTRNPQYLIQVIGLLYLHIILKQISRKPKRLYLKDDIPSSVQISEYLYNSGIQSLFIEGGAEVLNHFISTGIMG